MSEPAGISHSSAHLDALRGQIRAALITKKRGEARHLLGQLISLSNGDDGSENLKSLLDAVAGEVKGYISASGSVRDRLVAGTPLPSIQGELDSTLPHWRAFVNDFPELQLAKKGLAPHEDPALKIRVVELEKKIAKGSVAEAVLEWDELGRPESAARGIFVQILDGLSTLAEGLETRHWGQASVSHAQLEGLCDSEDAGSLQPGLGNFLSQAKNTLRWEGALSRLGAAGQSGDKGRRKLLEELFKAKDEIQRLSFRDKSLGDLQDRVEVAIEELSRTAPDEPERGGLPKTMLIVFLLFIVGIILIWLYVKFADSPPPGSGTQFCPQIGFPASPDHSELALQGGAIWFQKRTISHT